MIKRYDFQLIKKQNALNVLGKFEFLPGDDILTSNAQIACRNEVAQTHICQNILFLMSGFNSELLDEVSAYIISF